MDLYRFINLICLCFVNGFFTLAGIFLNSIIIISLWKSSQLRRKTCHFLILVLSCFDLAVVLVGHPTIMLTAISSWSSGYKTALQISKWFSIAYIVLQGLAFCALLTMNIDRYLAIAHPLFHKTSVTKSRLLKLMLVLQLPLLVVPFSSSIAYLWKLCNIIPAVFVAILVTVMLFINGRMFVITQSKTRAIAVQRSTRSVEVKRCHTCLVVMACFLICVSPAIAYNALRFHGITFDGMFRFWAATAATMISSLNCVIFAWRNRVLYTEVKKTLTFFTCWTFCCRSDTRLTGFQHISMHVRVFVL